MRKIFRFIFCRVMFVIFTFLFVTFCLFVVTSCFSVEDRALLYFPKNPGYGINEDNIDLVVDDIIKTHGLNDPIPVQYFHWLRNLLLGEWGWSPTAQDDVLSAILRLTPATTELTLFSILVFVPLGLFSGVIAGSNQNKPADHFIRFNAFLATAIPPFILAILLMVIFYVTLKWFPPGRLSDALFFEIRSASFRQYTGLITIDGLLNGRPDIFVDALRHLVLPVITLSAYHWSSLTRITRVMLQEELPKDYITSARARGLTENRLVWQHAVPNTLAPALNSTILSAASLMTGVMVVESIFNFPGISAFLKNSLVGVPDIPAVLGFSVYIIGIVLLLMVVLEITQALVDPRFRPGGQDQ
jgi:peptide/nickel transport system permease protein